MLNELSQEYIVAARAKGLSEARVIWRHALRNAAVPLVTVIALSYAGLLEGSVLTETVFAWPGLGLYLTNSLQNADMNAVLGGTLVIGVVFIGTQPALRPALPAARSEDTLSMAAPPAAPPVRRRAWLLHRTPGSRAAGPARPRLYVAGGRSRRNPLALARARHRARC